MSAQHERADVADADQIVDDENCGPLLIQKLEVCFPFRASN